MAAITASGIVCIALSWLRLPCAGSAYLSLCRCGEVHAGWSGDRSRFEP